MNKCGTVDHILQLMKKEYSKTQRKRTATLMATAQIPESFQVTVPTNQYMYM